MADANKVKFGLKNVYYAKISAWTAGVPTYATPVAIPGAVNLSLAAQGDNTTFYADDSAYYSSTTNNGYSGDLEVAKFPDSFYTDIFSYETNATSGLVAENADVEPASFALLFEFKGDANKTRHVMYNCTCSRPDVASATTAEGKEVQTEKATITAIPLPADSNGKAFVKGKCVYGDSAYTSFFSAVVMPTA